MRRTRYLTLLILALALPVMACGDDDDNGMGPDNLVAQFEGSWTTQSFTYTSKANSNISVDISSLDPPLGIQSLSVTESGSFSGVLVLPSIGSQNIAGQLTNVTESSLTIDFTAAVNQAGQPDLTVMYDLSGDILTFSSDDVDFDFDQDGQDEDASLRVVLARN